MNTADVSLAPGEAKRSAWRVTILSFLIVMVDGYDSLMVSFIAPLLAHQWRLKPTDIGSIFAVGYFGAIVGAIAMGLLADRLGRKPVLIASLALAALSTFLCASAPSLQALIAFRFVAGVALGGALPAAISLTAEHAGPARRSGAVTLMYIGYPMGAVVGGALTAAFLSRGWPSIFVAAGGASLLAALLAFALPESYRRPRPAAGRRNVGAAAFEQFAEGRLWPALTLMLGLLCMLLLTYFLVSWGPSLIVARGGTPKAAALGGVLLNLGGIIGAALMAPLINRFGPYAPAAILVGLGAPLIALLGWNLGSPGLMLALLFGCGVCVMGGQLNIPAMTVDLFPAHVRGRGGGWTVGVGRLGSIVGPALGGVLIAARLAPDRLFLMAAAPALVAAAALLAAAALKAAKRARG